MWSGVEDSVLGCVFPQGQGEIIRGISVERCAAAALDIPGDVMGGTGRS